MIEDVWDINPLASKKWFPYKGDMGLLLGGGKPFKLKQIIKGNLRDVYNFEEMSKLRPELKNKFTEPNSEFLEVPYAEIIE